MANCLRLSGGSQLPLGRDERHQFVRARLVDKSGAQVGTVIAIQLPFLTGMGLSKTNVGFEPKYGSSRKPSDCVIRRWSSRVFRVVPRRSTEIRASDGVPKLPLKKSTSSAEGLAS